MAVSVNQYVEWRAGSSSPVKYSFAINAQADVTAATSTTITVRLWGNLTITNHPNNSRNSWPASDFAILTLGGYDPANYSFTPGTSYYKAALPIIPNAPQAYYDAMLAEFRGDTYRSDGPNCSSLWLKGQGVVLNRYDSDGSRTFPIDMSFTVTLSGQREQPILIWNTSGANSSVSYGWLQHQVWLSLVDLDYRPGKLYDNNIAWQSHNRGAGAANILAGNTWTTMRTMDGGDGSGNPPTIRHGSGFKNMRRIGGE